MNSYNLNNLTSFDGTKIYFHSWAKKDSLAKILCIPGYAEHGKRYSSFANFFQGHNINVFAIDNRGHGVSEGERGYVRNFIDYSKDFNFLFNLILSQLSEKIFILGHSMGGLIACDYVLNILNQKDKRLSGLILSSPLFKLRLKAPIKEFIGKSIGKIFPHLRLGNEINENFLTHDVDIVNQYRTDPLIFKFAVANWFREMQKKQKIIEKQISDLHIPLLLILAKDDVICDTDFSIKLFEKIRYNDKNLLILDGHYHEILNELNREENFRRILLWIEERS